MKNRLVMMLNIMLGICVGAVGCATDMGDGKGDAVASDKADRWNATNNPTNFSGTLVYDLMSLPRQGAAAEPSWPSTYWPTYEDSINVRWRSGELTPAQKYDRAFNNWTPSANFSNLRPFDRDNPSAWDPSYYTSQGPLASYVSNNMGNGSDRSASQRCLATPLPSTCARAGVPKDQMYSGVSRTWPVETWWGLCHAWVPAAMLEARPLTSVTYNGVTFHVGDMEALLIAAYNRAGANMIGGRCNDGSSASSPVERDAQGRPIDVECRDTNAGSFHVIMTNYLGLQRRPYAEDRTFDFEVWNQPVVDFEVTKMDVITAQRAQQLLGLTGNTYTLNPDARTLYEVNASTGYITESHASTTPANPGQYTRRDYYTYILEVDGAGKIIGGEWTGNTRSNHPDFLWDPSRLSRSSIPNLDLDKVRMLIEMSRGGGGGGGGGGTGSTVTAQGQGGLSIPDNRSTGVSGNATVTSTATVATVRLTLDIRHTYMGDLQVYLKKDGREILVRNQVGGSSDNFSGTIDVTGFEGIAAGGTWTLRVVDRASQDVGTVQSWSLSIGTGTGGGGTTTGTTYTGSVGSRNIPDNNSTGVSGTATIPSGTTATRLEVPVKITHTYIGDLRITLTNGTSTWTLHNNEGGGTDNIDRVFNVGAGTGGTNPLPQNMGGTWTLKIVDSAGADVGTLDAWSMIVYR